ncbi:nuclear transport factor 2 family protein [Pseudomonas sp. LS44]|uniref:YybH family protein n=1 Tax=Pseudomonas sp. LS44 TaxID=1357074 RepID=UPI00215A5B4A|nr:nuclear transport factor 2 family protein [Pseudomonas sp. LS44]UVE17680.1 nuclear transport factor 2 family protein [Pseudomonas sp. LS44]
MNSANPLHGDLAQLHALLDSWAQGFQAKDVDQVMSTYSEDIVAFDAIQQLQFKGRDAYRAHWQACMAMCPGLPTYAVSEQNISISGELAIAHYLGHCGGTDAEGNCQGGWSRVTQGFRKLNDRWLIFHEHFSFPVDIESGKALFDATP